MDAFYASVEQRDNPSLMGKPIVVGGSELGRGVVATCSYEARVFGVRSAMPAFQARQLCPKCIFVKPRSDVYKSESIKIRKILNRYSDTIESVSLDEAYLDVTDSNLHDGSATKIAQSIKKEIKKSLSLTASAGVSYNKFLAKIASDYQKPDGLTVILPQEAVKFVEGLPIGKFHGVGSKTKQKMHRLNIYTGKDLKRYSQIELEAHFGKFGKYLYNIARSVDNREVKTNRKIKSLGRETTLFERRIYSKKEIFEILSLFISRIKVNIDAKNLKPKTLSIVIKYKDFKLITRSLTKQTPFVVDKDIYSYIDTLLEKTEYKTKSIRLIGIRFSNFV